MSVMLSRYSSLEHIALIWILIFQCFTLALYCRGNAVFDISIAYSISVKLQEHKTMQLWFIFSNVLHALKITAQNLSSAANSSNKPVQYVIC